MTVYLDSTDGFAICNHDERSYLVRAHTLSTADEIKVIVREIPYTDTAPDAQVFAAAGWDYFVASWRDRGSMTQSVRINTADVPLHVLTRPVPRPQRAARMRSPIEFDRETGEWKAFHKNRTEVLEKIGPLFLRGFARGVFDSLVAEGVIS